MLTTRDRAILDDLNKFRVMDRDSIAELHFKGLKNPKYAANNILLRLHREGYVQRSTAFVPYMYFGSEVSMKKKSAKIGHFLAIVEVYKEMKRLGEVDTFLVEPKFGNKGKAEPDIFCIYRRTPFFIEVQKSIYSEKQIKDKMDRYLDLYNSRTIENEPWQPTDKKVFPHVLILSDQRFPIDGLYPFRIMQAPSFSQFLKALKVKNGTQKQENITVKSNLKIKN